MDYVWLVVALASGTASNLFWKEGMLRVGQSPQNLKGLPRFLLRAARNPFVIVGVVLTVIFMASYPFAMSMFPLSYLLPIGTAIPLVLTIVFCLYFFKEKVSRISWLGIAIICVGAIPLGIAMGLE